MILERGPQGDHGQDGQDGQDGADGHDGAPGQTGARGPAGDTGVTGNTGRRGAPLSRTQAGAIFLLLLIIGLTGAWRLEVQADRIETQQNRITRNELAIRQAQHDRCLSGVEILRRFNTEQDALAAIERSLVRDKNATAVGKRVGTARAKVYEAARTLPLPQCGEAPR